MSHWPTAMKPATSAVTPPISATMNEVSGEWCISTLERTMMYTPAVTIVAAWISALAGVGPAIASGSQVKSGICADLPVTPSTRNSVMIVSQVEKGSTIGPMAISRPSSRKRSVWLNTPSCSVAI